MSDYDTVYRDLVVREHDEVHVGPVVIRIRAKRDKYVYDIQIGDDELLGTTGYKWRDEAAKGAMQVARVFSDIREGKTTEALLRSAAAKKKGALSKQYEFFAKHYDNCVKT